jgi:hypothetical protein
MYNVQERIPVAKKKRCTLSPISDLDSDVF